MEENLDLSIVIPLLNEEEVVPVLLKEITGVCEKTGRSYEIILVDDGSQDKTFSLLSEAAEKDARIKAVRLSRNFGHQAAFSAGIDLAQGEMVITMDGDLQHPPSLIPVFLKHADEGYDIILGERIINKQSSRGREWLGRFIYWLFRIITDLELRANVNDFGLYNRSVVSVLKRLPEKERFLRGMIQWVGFRKKYVSYVAEARRCGVPKYNFRRLASLVMSGITSFSALPLRLSFWCGLLVLFASVVFSGYVAVDHYINPNPMIAGWATLVILVLFLGSIQLMVLGVVGEYLYKMFNEIKARPIYIITETRNVEKEKIDPTSYGIRA